VTPAPPLTLDQYAEGVLGGDRAVLGRAITLVESGRVDHRKLAAALLERLLPHTGAARRVGITGVPGVGKSTFIDQLGVNLTAAGHRVAVLAVDPTSRRTGGSILGDKTRMERLANDPNAFVRPSPAGATLGGVTRTSREVMVVCEAAGYDVVLVETVGVGQSETMVAEMVDFFLVLMLAGAGDELQGIKKGILELADAVAVNKADGDNAERALRAASDYRHALRLTTPASAVWEPPVMTCSALANEGLVEIWEQIQLHHARMDASGELAVKRSGQQLRWMWSMVEENLLADLHADPRVRVAIAEVEPEVRAGRLPAPLAAERILGTYRSADGVEGCS